MNYPIDLSFKLMALASQVYVRDANGGLLGYVKQKMLKLKEEVTVFADEAMTQVRYEMKADRMMGFSARFTFTDATGNVLGALKRQGMRSIWKANYQVTDANDNQVGAINEENAWVKVIDAVVGELPIVGMFTGYIFNPTYLLTRMDGSPMARLAKQPAFFQGSFQLTSLGQMTPEEETRALLSFMMMTLLERRRG
jgi:hypothetical protein